MLGIYRSKLLKEDAMAWACHKAVTVGRQFFAQQSLEKAGRSGVVRGPGNKSHIPAVFVGAKSENTLVSIIEAFVGLNPKENEHASICHFNHSRGHDARTRGYGVCPVEG
jgi:hypothetical protein